LTHYYAPPTEISVVEDSWILIAALAVIGVIGLGIFGAVLTAQSSGPTSVAPHGRPLRAPSPLRPGGRQRYPTASTLAGQDNQAASDSVYR
jgi:hypothetical protein